MLHLTLGPSMCLLCLSLILTNFLTLSGFWLPITEAHIEGMFWKDIGTQTINARMGNRWEVESKWFLGAGHQNLSETWHF